MSNIPQTSQFNPYLPYIDVETIFYIRLAAGMYEGGSGMSPITPYQSKQIKGFSLTSSSEVDAIAEIKGNVSIWQKIANLIANRFTSLRGTPTTCTAKTYFQTAEGERKIWVRFKLNIPRHSSHVPILKIEDVPSATWTGSGYPVHTVDWNSLGFDPTYSNLTDLINPIDRPKSKFSSSINFIWNVEENAYVLDSTLPIWGVWQPSHKGYTTEEDVLTKRSVTEKPFKPSSPIVRTWGNKREIVINYSLVPITQIYRGHSAEVHSANVTKLSGTPTINSNELPVPTTGVKYRTSLGGCLETLMPFMALASHGWDKHYQDYSQPVPYNVFRPSILYMSDRPSGEGEFRLNWSHRAICYDGPLEIDRVSTPMARQGTMLDVSLLFKDVSYLLPITPVSGSRTRDFGSY